LAGCNTTSAATGADSSDAPADLGEAVTPDLRPAGCAPRDVTGFTPEFRLPHRAMKVCTPAEIDLLLSDWVLGSVSKRLDYQNQHTQCLACAVTRDDQDLPGPLLYRDEWAFVDGNISACLYAIDDNPADDSCAGHAFVDQECEYSACWASCPVDTELELGTIDQCRDQAAMTVCSSYHTAWSSCHKGLYAACDPKHYPSTEAWFRALVQQLCGAS
jgi:hypothetical protein